MSVSRLRENPMENGGCRTLVGTAATAVLWLAVAAQGAGCRSWLVVDSAANSPSKVAAKSVRADEDDRSDAGVNVKSARPQSESTNNGDLLNEVATDEPHRVLRTDAPNYWDCELQDLQEIALTNVAIIRDRNQFLSPGSALMSNPDLTASGFDPAIQEAGGPFNGTGVDQALGDFDPFFITRTVWGRNELLQNNKFLSGGLAPGQELDEDSAAFSARVEQTLSSGGVVSVGQEWDYNLNNVPARLYPSIYTGRLYGEFRQPLLAGAGSDFTSVAGPLWRNPTGNTLNQGVVIARLNTEMSMYDFENRVQTLLKSLEDAWWDLALAYETYNAELESRENFLRTWQKVQGRFENGLEGVGAADEAQARENYYEHCASTDDALTSVYQRETQLRRLVGLPVNDGRLIRPREALETDEKTPDWHQALAQALTQRVELRRQKTNLRGLAAQRDAAHNLTRPRFDFISGYQLNGFGDNLFDINSDTSPFPSAYGTQFSGNQTGWNLGFEFSLPIGFRAPLARQRNLELRLAKGNAALHAQELEISHELANAFQQADRWVAVSQSNLARLDAARQRLSALEADYNAGRVTADPLLRAQSSQMLAEVACRRSFAEYRKALAELSFRMGAILDRYQVALAETVRDPKAYAQALQANLERVKRGEATARLESEPEFEVLPASHESRSSDSVRARPATRSRANAQP